MKNSLLIGLLIFTVAAIFRLFFMDLIEYKYDEAITVYEMVKFHEQPYFMQTGPIQSTGIYNFPLYNYLILILSFLSLNPYYLSFFIALINTFGIVLLYFLIKKLFGNLLALISSLMISISPWHIIYSRKIWIPDLIFIFLIPYYYFLHKVINQKNKQSVFWLFLLMALLMQLHASGIFLALASIIILICFRVKINLKNALKGFGVGFIPAIPYLIKQITSNPFCPDCNALFSYHSLSPNFDFANFIRPFQILTGFEFKTLLGEDNYLFNQSQTVNFTYIIFFLEALIIILGIYYIITKFKEYRYLVYIILLTPIFYFLTKTPSFMHYYIVLYPAIVIIFAIPFINFARENKLIYKKLMVIFLLIIVSSNVAFLTIFFQFINQQKIIKGDYGTIFSLVEKEVDKQLKDYYLLPYYNNLKYYSYMYAQTVIFHPKLGEYFLSKNEYVMVINEFKKAILDNGNDITSRANLIILYYKHGDKDLALKELEILSTQNSTVYEQLIKLLNI